MKYKKTIYFYFVFYKLFVIVNILISCLINYLYFLIILINI